MPRPKGRPVHAMTSAWLPLIGLILVPAAVTAGTSSPSPEAGLHAPPGPVWLSGPFGRIPGATDADSAPTTTPGSGVGLDAWAPLARLRIDAGRDQLQLATWRVSSTSATGETTVLALAGPADEPRSVVTFGGPAGIGEQLLTALVTTTRGEQQEARWLLSVPDRPPIVEGVPDLVPPAVLLDAGPASLAGRPGDGCYVYTCVEIGRPPDDAALEPLRVPAGTPLTVHLADASLVTAWRASRRPTGTDSDEQDLGSGEAAAGVGSFELAALPPGDWLVVVEVALDRERGWTEAFFRLSAEVF